MVCSKQFRGIFFVAIIFFFVGNAFAQDWNRRHQFAKSYFGISNYIVPDMQSGAYLDAQGAVQAFDRSGFISPAVNIGATHFWGYADFYVSINTVGIKFGEDVLENSIRLGTFTGLRIYPVPSEIKTIRPYVGYKFSPFRYRQSDLNGQNYKFTQVKSVVDLGVGIQLPNFYFTLEYGRVAKPDFETYLSRDLTATDVFPKHLFQLGLNYTIETTKSASNPVNRLSNTLFDRSNKWGLFFALGPSSVFPIGTSTFVKELYPFLDDKSFPVIFPDVAMGYHFTRLDIVTAASFRPINQSRSAFGYEHEISRKSLNLEAYKFLGDYHGFVPYLGIGLGVERFTLVENEIGQGAKLREGADLSPSIVFGWDIRPSVKGDWWILRTNLRYFPFLEIPYQGKTLSLQHMEFNFIQFVVYPQRFKQIKKIIAEF